MDQADMITIERGCPHDDVAGAAPQELPRGELAGHLQDRVEEEGQRLYALLDAARGDLVLEQLAEVCVDRGEYEVLGPGRADDALFSTSTILVTCPQGSSLLSWLCAEGLGQSYGVLLSSEAAVGELAAHLHPLTEVRDEHGRALLFRFHDPRVLRVYLPTCTPWELRRFFGPVERFWAEAPQGAGLLEFARPVVEGEEEEELEEAGDALAGQTIIAEDRPDLVIRQAQMEAFAAASGEGFQQRVRGHLREHFPEDCAGLGDEGLDEAVRHGVERAAAHGLGAERDVCLYVGLVFLFGPGFDEDQPWAGRILGDRAGAARGRMDALWAEAERRLEADAATGTPKGAA